MKFTKEKLELAFTELLGAGINVKFFTPKT
jgi:hypothetical protein